MRTLTRAARPTTSHINRYIKNVNNYQKTNQKRAEAVNDSHFAAKEGEKKAKRGNFPRVPAPPTPPPPFYNPPMPFEFCLYNLLPFMRRVPSYSLFFFTPPLAGRGKLDQFFSFLQKTKSSLSLPFFSFSL
jgi:hypothetical protein